MTYILLFLILIYCTTAIMRVFLRQKLKFKNTIRNSYKYFVFVWQDFIIGHRLVPKFITVSKSWIWTLLVIIVFNVRLTNIFLQFIYFLN